MSGEKVTYILGAGASYYKFPLVKKTEGYWKNRGLAEVLVEEGASLPARFINHALSSKANYIGEAMKLTGANAAEFGNVDSYAKYLYHTQQFASLQQLKVALTFYFVRQQICKEYQHLKEIRYLNFITSLINEESKFPDNVKIINWNYDFQFQIAAMRYRAEKLYHMGPSIKREPAPSIEYFPPQGMEKIKNISFSLVHLNGIAGLYPDMTKIDNRYFLTNLITELLNGNVDNKFTEIDLLTKFTDHFNSTAHLITFAWEDQSDNQRYLGNPLGVAAPMIKGTTILVVIGYSFPFYNRESDNIIFNTIRPTLNKIYFQDPNKDGQFLRKRYGLMDSENFGIKKTPDVDIEHITDTDQFYIPVEV